MLPASYSRREVLAALASTAVFPLISACGGDGTARNATSDPDAIALLEGVADNFLALYPEQATSLGIDKDARAALRSQLSDRSLEGQQRIAQHLRTDLDRLNAFNADGLSYDVRTSVEVVRSVYTTALEGFALPYGDVAVGSWRNTPYVVIQNVGAYLDIPRFLDSDHLIENAADAESYLARAQSYAKQLDGELGRIQAARAAGLVPPAFLIDKALGQMRLVRAALHSRRLRLRSTVRLRNWKRSARSRPTMPASRHGRSTHNSVQGLCGHGLCRR